MFEGSFTGNNGKIVFNSNAMITISDSANINMDITLMNGANAAIITPPYTDQGLGHAVTVGKLELLENSTVTIKFDPTKYQKPFTGIEFNEIKLNTGSTLNIEGSVVQCYSESSIGKTEGASETTINMY